LHPPIVDPGQEYRRAHIIAGRVTSGAPSKPNPGHLVAGKYRVDRVLGEGGMGVVVAATHIELDQKVALKFLLPALAARPELVQRFLREARAAVKIQSEHVARVLDVGTHEGTPYMVMEYLEGGDLATVLAERGPLPVGEAVGYLLEASEAIAEAHSLGIIHRDLKPANLFLAARPNGKAIVKVLDFGISKAPSAGKDANLTKTSAIMGSPNYMSPEQLVSASTVDVHADVWALGVVLYEMLTQKLPFEANTMPELVGVILQRAHEPLGAVRHDLPAALIGSIDRCLEKEPAKRYANVADLASALLPFGPPQSEQLVERIRHVLGHFGPPADRPSTGTRVPAPPAVMTFSPITSATPSHYNRRLLIAGPLVAMMLVGAAAVVVVVRASKSSAPPPPSLGMASAVATPPEPVVPPPAAAPSPAPAPGSPDPLTANPLSPKATSSLATEGQPATRNTARSPSPHPRSSAAAPDAGPSCHLVVHVDELGDKHFVQECR
jgi:serine/threonine protein kinase